MEFTAYLFEGSFDKNNSERTDSLIRESVEKYCRARGLEVPEGEIKRTEKGKPYISDSSVHFSVSHSGEMAVIMVGEAECGIDLQVMEVRNHKAIAGKYYTENEKAFVDRYGLEGFFRIWVHREAFGKLTGEGMLSEMPDFIDSEGFPEIAVEKGQVKAFIRDVPVAQDIFMAFATYGEDDTLEFSL